MPKNRSATGRYYAWPSIIDAAQKARGEFVLALPDAPASVLETIRLRRHPDLRMTGGYLLTEMRNRHTLDDTVRGDVYVAWATT